MNQLPSKEIANEALEHFSKGAIQFLKNGKLRHQSKEKAKEWTADDQKREDFLIEMEKKFFSLVAGNIEKVKKEFIEMMQKEEVK